MPRRIISRTGRHVVNASGRAVVSGGGATTVATTFSTSLTHGTGSIGTSETLTVTPLGGGVWPAARSLAVTQGVSMFSVGSFVQPTAGTVTPLAIPLTVTTAGGPATIDVVDSGASPMTSTGGQTYTATSGGGGSPTLLQSFVLTNNNSGGTSPGFHRGGVPFVKGAVPAGTSVQIKRSSTVISAQFDERVTWTDGSLKYAVMHLRDTTFSAGEARTYDVWTVPGTAFNNTGTQTTAALANNYKMNFWNITETDYVTTSAVADLAAVLNVHLTVPTRVEKVHSGPVCEGWVIWGMAYVQSTYDGTTSSPADPHLKVNWHVDVWKDAGGTVIAHEVGAVVAMDWWSVPNKKRRLYDATLSYGAGFTAPGGPHEIQSYMRVNAPYHSWWMMCQPTGVNRGKRFWWIANAAVQQPTLTYAPSKAYWVSSQVMPPYDANFTPNAHPGFGSGTYVPTSSFDHRYELNAAAGYDGRGVLTNMDAMAFMRQGATDVATARINAFVGMHLPINRRSNRTRTRPTDAGVADTANTICSLIMRVSTDDGSTFLGSLPSYDFTADGMPIPVNAYAYGSGPYDGYTNPGGNQDPYAISQPYCSHRPNYAYYIYLLEGERYMLETLLNHGVSTVQDGYLDWQDRQPVNWMLFHDTDFLAWNQSRSTAEQNANVYGRFDAIALVGEERNFAAALLGAAAGLVPDAHVSAGFIKRLNYQQWFFADALLRAAPPDVLAAGLALVPGPLDGGVDNSPWMSGITCLCTYFNAQVTESAAAKRFADHYAMQAIGLWEHQSALTDGAPDSPYRWSFKPSTGPYNRSTNACFPRGGNTKGSLNLDGFTSGSATQSVQYGIVAQVGDIHYWHSRVFDGYTSDTPYTPPGGLADGAPLYVISVSAPTLDGLHANLQWSLTPGGAPFVWTTAASHMPMELWIKGPSLDYANARLGNGNGGDSYGMILRGVVIAAKQQGNVLATQTLVDRANAILNPANALGYAAWKYA